MVTRLNGLGFELSLDKRAGFYYPRSGYQVNLKYFTYPGVLGNEYVSNKIEFDYDHYFPLRNNQDVLAGRLYAGLGIGDLSFNQQFIVGQTDIRGYTQGAYRGNHLLAEMIGVSISDLVKYFNQSSKIAEGQFPLKSIE